MDYKQLKNEIDEEMKKLELGKENEVDSVYKAIVKKHTYTEKERLLIAFYLSGVLDGSVRIFKYTNNLNCMKN